MKKMGRPKLPQGEQKVHFTLRLKRDDLAAITKAAKRVNAPLRDWAASTLTNAAK